MAPELPLAFGLLEIGLTLAGLLALVLAVAAVVSVANDNQLSSSAKVMWIVIVALFPILGAAVYFGVRRDW
jgi:Phospholipase_D-nuclease N-terminal